MFRTTLVIALIAGALAQDGVKPPIKPDDTVKPTGKPETTIVTKPETRPTRPSTSPVETPVKPTSTPTKPETRPTRPSTSPVETPVKPTAGPVKPETPVVKPTPVRTPTVKPSTKPATKPPASTKPPGTPVSVGPGTPEPIGTSKPIGPIRCPEFEHADKDSGECVRNKCYCKGGKGPEECPRHGMKLCGKCRKPLVISEDRTHCIEFINECPDGTISLGGVCKVCPPGTYLRVNECLPNRCKCADGEPADPCAKDLSVECGKCFDGFILNPRSKRCDPIPTKPKCPENMVPIVGSRGACECAKGFSLDGEDCVKDKCPDGHVFAPFKVEVCKGGLCFPKPGGKCIENVMVRCLCKFGKPFPKGHDLFMCPKSNPHRCGKCMRGYFLTKDSRCEKVAECAKPFVSVDGDCVACEPGTTYHPPSKRCRVNRCKCDPAKGREVAPGSCQKDSSVECASCLPGFLHNKDTLDCDPVPCPAFLVNVGGECVPCRSGTSYNPETGRCRVNKCKCHPSKGKAPAPGSCRKHNSIECVSCLAGFVHNADTLDCDRKPIECPENMFLKGRTCVCNKGFKPSDDDKKTCVIDENACPEFHFFQPGEGCLKNKCRCDNGKPPVDTCRRHKSFQCAKCRPGFTLRRDGKCHKNECRPGLVFNEDSGECGECPEFQHPTKAGGCEDNICKCHPKKGLAPPKGECKKHISYECRSCNKHFVLHEDECIRRVKPEDAVVAPSI